MNSRRTTARCCWRRPPLGLLVPGALMVPLLTLFSQWTEAQIAVRGSTKPQEFSASGEWQSDVAAARTAQRMTLRVRQSEDGTVAGSVQVAGSPLLRNGTVEGKIRGAFVSGIVKDESGEVAARFTGRIEPDGSMTGTYTDRTGEVGSWRWPDSAQGRQAEE